MKNYDSEDEETEFWNKKLKLVPGKPVQVITDSGANSNSNTCFQDFGSKSSSNKVKETDSNLDCNKSEKTKCNQESDSKDVTDARCTIHNCRTLLLSSLSSNRCNISVAPGKQRDLAVVHNPPKTINYMAVGAIVSKTAKFVHLLQSNLLNLEDLQLLSWTGIPMEIRPIAWRLLAGYLPTNLERRLTVMKEKRLSYWNLVKQYFDKGINHCYRKTHKQIQVDIPRMSPHTVLFQQPSVQKMFERILFIWSIRHPGSGYVQGINDLVTPFFIVFLKEFLPAGDAIDDFKVSSLPKEQQNIVEADTFWCFSNFINGIQDNYVFSQLGIQRQINQLKELIQRIDGTLHEHLQNHGVDYLQFSFRWMNNLLTREIPLRSSIRMWDTYLAEADNFASFHQYVCAAFLLYWKQKLLLERDFQGLMITLQNLPTQNWTDTHIEVLLAEAYRLKFLFSDAPNHLQSNSIR